MIRPSAAAGVLAFALAVVTASATAAQSWSALPPSDDWDAAAVAQWDSGVAMVAHCRQGNFRFTTELVAPMEGTAARVEYSFDEGETRPRLWALSASGDAVSARPSADFARELLSAQSLEMTLSDGRTPQQRYVLGSPGEPGALEAVLTACGEPLVAGQPPRRVANPEPVALRPQSALRALYPARAMRRGTSGVATVECIVNADSRLEECLTTWEDPEGEGFGDATVAAMEGSRIGPTEAGDGAVIGSVLSITLRWGPRY